MEWCFSPKTLIDSEGTPYIEFSSHDRTEHNNYKSVFHAIVAENIKNVLLHAPIYIILKNVGERNEKAKKNNTTDDVRDPKEVLKQYLEKYEATTQKPSIEIGDPTTELTKDGLICLLKSNGLDDEYINFNTECDPEEDDDKIEIDNEEEDPEEDKDLDDKIEIDSTIDDDKKDIFSPPENESTSTNNIVDTTRSTTTTTNNNSNNNHNKIKPLPKIIAPEGFLNIPFFYMRIQQ